MIDDLRHLRTRRAPESLAELAELLLGILGGLGLVYGVAMLTLHFAR